ncbi:MAG: hypothetical protein QY331_10550 [Melioribacteraceae bacterium]|nr:MAG: hypothetical protein QY331_10550 [Melioribacteraceae bacterium]
MRAQLKRVNTARKQYNFLYEPKDRDILQSPSLTHAAKRNKRHKAIMKKPAEILGERLRIKNEIARENDFLNFVESLLNRQEFSPSPKDIFEHDLTKAEIINFQKMAFQKVNGIECKISNGYNARIKGKSISEAYQEALHQVLLQRRTLSEIEKEIDKIRHQTFSMLLTYIDDTIKEMFVEEVKI